jgi:surface antigen
MRSTIRAGFGSLAVAFVIAFSAGQAQAGDYWQCVPFARMISGIQIFGDAWTWWQQAAGKYAQGFTPKSGAVLVFRPHGPMTKGHVAVVSQVLTDRVIQVTQANWSIIEGSRGKVERDVTVVDVSPQGDWSQVKVWFDPVHDLGKTIYPTYGFIYQNTGSAAANAAETAVRSVARTAMNQLAAAVPAPGANPAQALSQAAGSTDPLSALIEAATGPSATH